MSRKILYLFIILLALALNLTAQTEVIKKDCSDIACHGNLRNNEVVHHPVKNDCNKCHEAVTAEHPVKDVKGFTLAQTVPALCYKCHDEKNTMSIVHHPIQQGKCLECHTPHSSPESNLLTKNPPSELCKQCHKLESASRRVKHAPVEKGECMKCHDAHQSDEPRLLAKSANALCLKCHTKQKDETKMANVHPPFQNSCLNCHSPHSSTESKLVNLTPQNLCNYCHSDMQKKVARATVVHGAVRDKKSCNNCHSPHASEHKNFLVAESKTLCLSCHDKTIAVGERKIANISQTLQKSKAVHGAITKNGCTGCHDPHATTNPFLLTKTYPAGTYAQASRENFNLCFSCHKSELLEKPVTLATGFRNGEKNLHFVHVNGEKGRNCSVCHNPHGSVNEFLINELAPFGNWQMPMKYQRIEGGGSCAPGCHAEKKYERAAGKLN